MTIRLRAQNFTVSQDSGRAVLDVTEPDLGDALALAIDALDRRRRVAENNVRQAMSEQYRAVNLSDVYRLATAAENMRRLKLRYDL